MLYFNKQYYQDWKLQKLAETNGADVHKVNGLLGNILNSIPNYCYWMNERDFESAYESRENILKALKNLHESEEVFHYFLLGEK
jgi:hypothetical protein